MTPRATRWSIGSVCIAYGIWGALRRAWVCDDAFISFRYARNLVEGRGLVFNPGEAVEGYTNFLWTLLAAIPHAAGIDPVGWSQAFGIAAYAACLFLLVARGGDGPLPVAAAAGAVLPQWHVWATGGLETSLFCLAALGGALLLSPPRPAAAGLVFGVATLIRPDGILFAGVGGLRFLARGGGWPRFVAAFLLSWAPHMLWRRLYYGEWLPNTYWAKSAYESWWSQGVSYSRLFFTQHFWLPLVPLAALCLLPHRRGSREAEAAHVLAGTALAAAYALWVCRVGGDFMYARLLMPTVPLLLLASEAGLSGGLGEKRSAAAGVVLVALAAAMPAPLAGPEMVSGVTREPAHHTPKWEDESVRGGAILRRYFAGLDVTVAFTGSEARLMYEARVPIAIEAETGLTDRTIARLPLAERGRPGHEKHAPLEYLLDRETHFTFKRKTLDLYAADGALPLAPVFFDEVRGFALHWDPALMEELARRGARFEDFPGRLDRVLPTLARIPPEEARKIWEMSRRFYFDHVDDPARRAVFEQVLGLLEEP